MASPLLCPMYKFLSLGVPKYSPLSLLPARMLIKTFVLTNENQNKVLNVLLYNMCMTHNK